MSAILYFHFLLRFSQQTALVVINQTKPKVGNAQSGEIRFEATHDCCIFFLLFFNEQVLRVNAGCPGHMKKIYFFLYTYKVSYISVYNRGECFLIFQRQGLNLECEGLQTTLV